MSVVDLIIIYLACGAPFGVFQITTTRPTLSARHLVLIASAFLLWPAFAPVLIMGRFRSSGERESAERRLRIENLRLAIEETIFGNGERMSAVFEFREVFHRFYGLLDAAESISLSGGPRELFKASDHPNSRLAARCLARRNFLRLKTHKDRARTELIELLFAQTAVEKRREITSLITDFGNGFSGNLDLAFVDDELETLKERRSLRRGAAV